MSYSSQVEKDTEDLAKLGYKQELNRNLGAFSNFAISFSFISATTGIFGLFGYGLATGGPAFVWSWPLVFVGQLMVALTMAEVVSHYPIAGSIYQWGKHLVNLPYAWLAGWMYLIATIATVAAVDFGAAPYLAQLFGMDASSHSVLFLFTVLLVVLQSIINILGIKVTAFVNNIGMAAEIIAMIVLAVALFAVGIHHPVKFLLDTGGTASGNGYLPVFLAALLTSTWVLYGFDSAGSLAEEVRDPRRAVPKALVSSLVLTFIIGGLALVAFILAIPDLKETMSSSVPLTYILESNLGTWMANGFVVIAVIAMFVCGTAIQATVSRLLYSFGRDNKLPGSKLWVKISKRYETPVPAIIFAGIVTLILTISASAESYIVNICVVGIYLAYLSVSVGALIAHSRGWDNTTSPWNLGKWGLPVNVIAAAWGIFVIINLSWPRSPDAAWYVNYSVPLLALVAIVIGAVYYATAVRPQEIVEARNAKNKAV